MQSNEVIFYGIWILEIFLILVIYMISQQKEEKKSMMKKQNLEIKKTFYLLSLFLMFTSIIWIIPPLLANTAIWWNLKEKCQFYCAVNSLFLMFSLSFRSKKAWSILNDYHSYLCITLSSIVALIIALSSNWYRTEITLVHATISMMFIIQGEKALKQEKRKLQDQEWFILAGILLIQIIYSSIVLFSYLRILFF
ncbi:MAG: hypothetical protein PUB18_04835 [bacterium]|nr:hypothetical protein [bacterium]